MHTTPNMEQLSIVWWNTSLYSYAAAKNMRRLDKKHALEVYEEIRALCLVNDIVFLGEFPNEGELKDLVISVNELLLRSRSNYSVCGDNLFYKKGRSLEFHNAVVYNSNKLKLMCETNEDRSITKYRNIEKRRNYRVAQRIRFKSCDVERAMEFYIVHWRKRDGVNGEEEKERKEKSADEILARISGFDSDYPYKMVLGDFNNEPYEKTIRGLHGTRSIEYARDNDALYNPFWMLMHGESGTIYSPNNENLRCNKPMFDFFLVNPVYCGGKCTFSPEIVNLNMSHRLNEHRPVKLTVTFCD